MSKSKRTKIIIIGDCGVGKSTILKQYDSKEFDAYNQIPTIGIDFITKIHSYKNKNYKLFVWDTAGQERYRSIVESYYRNIEYCIIVYDISSKLSSLSVGFWIKNIRLKRPDIPIIIVGNKLDLVNDDNAKFKFKNDDVFENLIGEVEITAKNYSDVHNIFDIISEDIFHNIEKSEKMLNDYNKKTDKNIKLNNMICVCSDERSRKYKCC